MPDFYTDNAYDLASSYNKLNFETVHSSWIEHCPTIPGLALDVGAGSGRDARALSTKNWTVYAVEPSKGLRTLGQENSAETNVHWLDDNLPALQNVRKLGLHFDLILVSAVWMHLPHAQREKAMRVLSDLLSPKGILVITLRHGPSGDARQFHSVNLAELERQAADRALTTLQTTTVPDQMKRKNVYWESAVFQLPDNGTGALPLLRHIIVNDNKSASYKLGLLRLLTRIADTLPGIVLNIDNDWITLPYGVVGLYWLKQYLPLLSNHKLAQHPGSKGYGFASKHFWSLAEHSIHQLSVGRRFIDDGQAVMGAINTACQHIVKMPAHYTTWPGTKNQVFEVDYRSPGRTRGEVLLNTETLSRFGTIRIPRHIWDCMSQYAVWVEPAIRREWINLMSPWNKGVDISRLDRALDWPEAVRDTTRVRTILNNLNQQGHSFPCIWSGKPLKNDATEIDHCIPWAHWQNNDLWNLFPSSKTANAKKSNKLPSIHLLQHSKDRILEWWDIAYVRSCYAEEFITSAKASLPGIESGDINTESIFQALLYQRDRIKQNQQLAEWNG